jgi:hypothetical protein
MAHFVCIAFSLGSARRQQAIVDDFPREPATTWTPLGSETCNLTIARQEIKSAFPQHESTAFESSLLLG